MWPTIVALLGGVILGVIATFLGVHISDMLREISQGLSSNNMKMSDFNKDLKEVKEKVINLENDSKQRHQSICDKVLDLDRTVKSTLREEEEKLDNRSI